MSNYTFEIFGAPHSVSQDIQGPDVLAVNIDQEKTQNIIITCKTLIKLFQCENRIVWQTWLCKTWFTPSAGCLNSKDGTFYCPVSDNKLMKWSSSDTHLDNIKPIKLSNKIHCLTPYKGQVYVVYTNGFVVEVKDAIQNRKIPDILHEGEQIKDVLILPDINNQDMVTLITTETGSTSPVGDRVQHYPLQWSQDTEVTLYFVSRPGLVLRGCGLVALSPYPLVPKSAVYSVWNNGDICYSPIRQSTNNARFQIFSRGQCLKAVNCSKPVRVVQPTNRHIALLGENPAKEGGGNIMLYDFEVDLEVAVRQFKLYNPRLRCWVHRGGPGGVLVHEKADLTVLPFDRLPSRKRAQLRERKPLSVSVVKDELVFSDGNKCKNVKPTEKTNLDDLCDVLCISKYLDEFKSLVLVAWLKDHSPACWPIVVEMIDRLHLSERCVIDLLEIVMSCDNVKLSTTIRKSIVQKNVYELKTKSKSSKKGKNGHITRNGSADARSNGDVASQANGASTNTLTGDRLLLVDKLLSVPFMQDGLMEQLRGRSLFYRHAMQLRQHLDRTPDSSRHCIKNIYNSRRQSSWLVAIESVYLHTMHLDQMADTKSAATIAAEDKKLVERSRELKEDAHYERLFDANVDLLLNDDLVWPSSKALEDPVYTISERKLPVVSADTFMQNNTNK